MCMNNGVKFVSSSNSALVANEANRTKNVAEIRDSIKNMKLDNTAFESEDQRLKRLSALRGGLMSTIKTQPQANSLSPFKSPAFASGMNNSLKV